MEEQQHTIALFGEAEKGDYHTAYFCRTLSDLVDHLGNPPSESQGIHCAVQALMYERDLIFIRVKEEGFSAHDYMVGLRLLERQTLIPAISAVCLPGVGDEEIIDAGTMICHKYDSVLITAEADLYDYLTCS
jgi:hypothetical protein